MARLEFIENIPKGLGTGGFVIAVLLILILVIAFLIFRFLKSDRFKQSQDKKRLERLKEKLEGLERIRQSEDKSPSEL
jgi:uncharacterized membrane protein